MKKTLLIIITVVIGLLGIILYKFVLFPSPPVETKFVQNVRKASKEDEMQEEVKAVQVKEPGDQALLQNPKHTYQTFNNCGPATLSMILSWYGKDVSQKELSNKMRPYQHPRGDNDDKTIFTSEFVYWAKNYGFESLERVNGDIDLLKTFTTNGIPVVVKTWLKVNDDIGHFRIVRGFDENKKTIIQDDSYHGPNKRISYFDFLSMWQPFNYNYIIVYPDEQKDLVEAIIGKEVDESVAWTNALKRSQKESELDPENVYPWFNMSSADYHLGEYQRSVEAFETVENSLPRRMLWYQIEPIRAYKALGNYQRVFQITDNIINNGNRAFSELYQIRGEVYLSQGDKQKAREQFETAILYNINFVLAKESLEKL